MDTSARVADLREHQIFDTPVISHEHSSGLSWSAVIGGAFVTAAISLIMLALGAGFGLSVVSPWSNVGVSAAAAGSAAIGWLIVTQVLACALGGYLAGRLRTKWVAVHTDEVHFRDTANGFVVWAVAVVITVTFLVSSAASMVGSSTSADRTSGDPHSYFVDRLFRSDASASQPIDPSVQAEANRILARPDATTADENYLARLVTARTGLSQPDAQKRVADVTAEFQQAEDAARRTAARLLLWIFLALLMGAFSASYAATIGGRQRDHVKAF